MSDTFVSGCLLLLLPHLVTVFAFTVWLFAGNEGSHLHVAFRLIDYFKYASEDIIGWIAGTDV